MWLVNYFDLGLLSTTLALGPKDEAARAKRAWQRFWLTALMYVGVVLGVLGENLLSLLKAGTPVGWATFGGWRVLASVVIAIVIFPQVFPRVFGKRPTTEAGAPLSGDWRFLQFCIAFQNGFFWQALISKLPG